MYLTCGLLSSYRGLNILLELSIFYVPILDFIFQIFCFVMFSATWITA